MGIKNLQINEAKFKEILEKVKKHSPLIKGATAGMIAGMLVAPTAALGGIILAGSLVGLATFFFAKNHKENKEVKAHYRAISANKEKIAQEIEEEQKRKISLAKQQQDAIHRVYTFPMNITPYNFEINSTAQAEQLALADSLNINFTAPENQTFRIVSSEEAQQIRSQNTRQR